MCASRSSPHLNARRVNDSQPVKATRRIDICLWYIYTDTCKSRHDVICLFFFFFLRVKETPAKSNVAVCRNTTNRRKNNRPRPRSLWWVSFSYFFLFFFTIDAVQKSVSTSFILYRLSILFFFILPVSAPFSLPVSHAADIESCSGRQRHISGWPSRYRFHGTSAQQLNLLTV